MDQTIKNAGFHVYKKTVPTLWGFFVGISKWIFMACQLELTTTSMDPDINRSNAKPEFQ